MKYFSVRYQSYNAFEQKVAVNIQCNVFLSPSSDCHWRSESWVTDCSFRVFRVSVPRGGIQRTQKIKVPTAENVIFKATPLSLEQMGM